jgi:hypothetical protein
MAQPRDEFIAFDDGVSLDQASERLGPLATQAGNLGNAKERLLKTPASTSALWGRLRIGKILSILRHWL